MIFRTYSHNATPKWTYMRTQWRHLSSSDQLQSIDARLLRPSQEQSVQSAAEARVTRHVISWRHLTRAMSRWRKYSGSKIAVWHLLCHVLHSNQRVQWFHRTIEWPLKLFRLWSLQRNPTVLCLPYQVSTTTSLNGALISVVYFISIMLFSEVCTESRRRDFNENSSCNSNNNNNSSSSSCRTPYDNAHDVTTNASREPNTSTTQSLGEDSETRSNKV